MSDPFLEVKDLHTGVEEKEILHGLNLTVGAGETHVIMGPNGAGKSTLGSTIMGDPRYKVSSGSVIFKGEDITNLSTDKIAKKGMFISFQNPIEVPVFHFQILSVLQLKIRPAST